MPRNSISAFNWRAKREKSVICENDESEILVLIRVEVSKIRISYRFLRLTAVRTWLKSIPRRFRDEILRKIFSPSVKTCSNHSYERSLRNFLSPMKVLLRFLSSLWISFIEYYLVESTMKLYKLPAMRNISVKTTIARCQYFNLHFEKIVLLGSFLLLSFVLYCLNITQDLFLSHILQINWDKSSHTLIPLYPLHPSRDNFFPIDPDPRRYVSVTWISSLRKM